MIEPTPTPENRQAAAAVCAFPIRVSHCSYRTGSCAAADEHAERDVEMPWLARQRSEKHSARHHHYAHLDDEARPAAVHQPTERRAQTG